MCYSQFWNILLPLSDVKPMKGRFIPRGNIYMYSPVIYLIVIIWAKLLYTNFCLNV